MTLWLKPAWTMAIVLVSFAALPTAHAQTDRSALPEIGSSAEELLSPAEERRYGAMLERELRRRNELLEDPLVEAWIADIGGRLGTVSGDPDRSYQFMLMRSTDINAFATLGGYVGVNAGLILAAEREDEVASVLAHEIAHVTQKHVLRGVERAQKDTLPILLAMLGAIAISQSGADTGDAAQAVIAGGMGLMQQRQINYTRSNEREADRLGIQALVAAGFDPLAMADFFGRLQRANRGDGAGVPEYLRSHPVTTDRISEATERAARATGSATPVTAIPTVNPLLPAGLGTVAMATDRPAPRFDFARERLRVLRAGSAREALADYARHAKAGPLTPAQRYGQALARQGAAETGAALAEFDALLTERPGDDWIALARAEVLHAAGRRDEAADAFESLLIQRRGNRAVSLAYARSLVEHSDQEDARRARDLLRPLLAKNDADLAVQRLFGRACELAGEPVRAGEAFAEVALLSGRPEDALNQLQRLLDQGDVDYYQRARISARIEQITPLVLELKRQGIKADQPLP